MKTPEEWAAEAERRFLQVTMMNAEQRRQIITAVVREAVEEAVDYERDQCQEILEGYERE